MGYTSITIGRDPRYPMEGAGTGWNYYLQGEEPPGRWAGRGAEQLGLAGQVDPKDYLPLYTKLIAPTGETLYSGKPPRWVQEALDDEAADLAAAVEGIGPFATPARNAPRSRGRKRKLTRPGRISMTRTG